MKDRGFTLIELLVVIAIIGVLSSVILVSLNTVRSKARDAQRQSDITEVNKAVQLYYDDNGSYPSTGGMNTVYMDPGCKTATAPDQVTSDWVPGLVAGKYIAALPKDPLPTDVVAGYKSGGACYMYSSDGKYYILSAWSTVENPITAGGLFSHAGYREANWNVQDATYLCNYPNSDLPQRYQHSYTISNEPCS